MNAVLNDPRLLDVLEMYATESRHAAREGLTREFAPLFAKLGVIFIAVLTVITLLQFFGVNVARVRAILREAAFATDLTDREREPVVLVTRLGIPA